MTELRAATDEATTAAAVVASSEPEPEPEPEPAEVSDTDSAEADLVRIAVLGCQGVAGVSAGAFGEVRAYLPGRSVPGIRIDDGGIAVHIVAHYGRPLSEIAAEISASLAPLMAGRQLRVAVEDILLPGETLRDDAP